jgi:hypothetical protein
VLAGRLEPGRVVDQIMHVDEVPDACRSMSDRPMIKTMIEFPGATC